MMKRRLFLQLLALGAANALLNLINISAAPEKAPQPQTASIPPTGQAWGFPLGFPAYFLPTPPAEKHEIYLPEVQR